MGSRRAAAAPPSALRLRAHALLADVLGGEFALPHLARLMRGSGSGGDSLLLSL